MTTIEASATEMIDTKASPAPRKIADAGLGVLGAVTLLAGVILLTALFLAFNSYATNTAIVLLVCGAVSTLIGGFSLVMLLTVKALGNS